MAKPELPSSVGTDASEYGIGCTLFQTYEESERKPVGCWSLSLEPAKKNYSNSERECLDVVCALLTLRPYLQFETFVVYTDHHALKWLLKIIETSSSLTRWRLRLTEFDFEVSYKKGNEDHHEDALSRLLTGYPTVEDDEYKIPSFILEEFEDDLDLAELYLTTTIYFIENDYEEVNQILEMEKERFTMEELLASQHKDAFCSAISHLLNKGEKLSFKNDDDGLLVRTIHADTVVPYSLKKQSFISITTPFSLVLLEGASSTIVLFVTSIGLQSQQIATRQCVIVQNAPKIG